MIKKRTKEQENRKKQKWRKKNRLAIREKQREYTKQYRQRVAPLGYIVEIDYTKESFYDKADFPFKSKYQTLKIFRQSFAPLIAKGHLYKVYEIKRSRFDIVPHEPD